MFAFEHQGRTVRRVAAGSAIENVTGAGIEPAARALKVSETTQLRLRRFVKSPMNTRIIVTVVLCAAGVAAACAKNSVESIDQELERSEQRKGKGRT